MGQANAAGLALSGGDGRSAGDARGSTRSPVPAAGLLGKAILIAAAVLLALQWHVRHDGYIAAKTGLGYYLGIAGAATMLLLLAYSMRKRFRFLRGLGRIQRWFGMHMFLGLLGPALIVAHSNFKLGSINSSVAMTCMLLVAGSGLIGRFIYTRIHDGLYGARSDLTRLARDIDGNRAELEPLLARAPRLRRHLKAFEAASLKPRGFIVAALRIPFTWLYTRWSVIRAYAAISVALRAEARHAGWTAKQKRQLAREVRAHLRAYLKSVRKTAGLTFFERLFALWHVLHIPLFFMMILATVAHVFAVHVY